jgi:hypothetical protein
MTTDNNIRTFRCRPSLAITLLGSVFFGACTAVLGYKALTNDRGLILDGVLEFGPLGATIFYWILTVLSALFVLAGAWTILTTLFHGVPDVVLTDTSIAFPVGFPIKRNFMLPYSEIAGLSNLEINGQRFLYVHSTKKKYCIALNWLGSKDEAREFHDELTRRVSEFSARTKD